MAELQTWTTLQADVAAQLKRSDQASNIKRWINQAELRISRELRPRGYQRYTTSQMTATDPMIEIPARLIGMISFILIDSAGARTPLFRREYSWLTDYWPNQSLTDTPLYYANVDGVRFKVAPTPDRNYEFELSYYERLQPLDAGNNTNWLTENAYDLLLYGALLEAPPPLRDDERAALWKAYYDRAAASLTAVEQAFKSDDQSMVKGGV